MKDMKVKRALSKGGYQWGGGKWRGPMYCVYMYENRTMKSVEIVVTREEEG
jgi:hypothetical protein